MSESRQIPREIAVVAVLDYALDFLTKAGVVSREEADDYHARIRSQHSDAPPMADGHSHTLKIPGELSQDRRETLRRGLEFAFAVIGLYAKFIVVDGSADFQIIQANDEKLPS